MRSPRTPGEGVDPASEPRALTACTIVAHNYLPRAMVLAQGFRQFHPSARFVVVVIDHPTNAADMSLPGIEVLSVSQIEFDQVSWRHLATMYNVTEFATSVKPFVLRHLLADSDCVLYLDPDIKLFADLDGLVERTIEAGISVTPHRLTPIPRDGKAPTEAQIMASGIYNLGYIGVAPSAGPFLDWWAERLSVDCVSDITNQLFTDQRWIDLAIPVFAPYVERSPAYNVAYWNVDALELREGANGIEVDGEPLRFIHFSGLDPERPWLLTVHHPGRPRTLLSEHPLLARLCADYCRELATADADPLSQVGYGWATTPDGLVLTKFLRSFVRSEVIRALDGDGPMPPTPFDDDGGSAFRELLTDAADVPWHLPLIAYFAWCERPDLQLEFGDLSVDGARERFVEWIRTIGVATYPGWDALDLGRDDAGSRRVLRAGTDPGVDLVGYLTTESGVGDAGRRLVAALQATDIPLATTNFDIALSRQDLVHPTDDVLRHDALILSVNADEVGTAFEHFGPELRPPGPVIGQWFWEVDRFPRHLAEAFELFDEVWVPTRHIADALAPWAGDKVAVMPIPLLPSGPLDGSADVDKRNHTEPFTFLFMFDFFSVFERKNPLAVVEAFRAAFADGEGPRLVIKSINGDRLVSELERLRWAARERRDIEIIDGYADALHLHALVRSCDCYISLHRAEGLGLTMAEAMALGKPVIATGYSGNVDFMTPETAFLIPFDLVEVGPGHDPYPARAHWADPDIAAAARAMRQVVDDPTSAVAVGRRARAHLTEHFSPAVTGRRMAERIGELRESSAQRPGAGPQATPARPATRDPATTGPIAIMSFNRPEYLAPVLRSLRAQDPPLDPNRLHLFQDGAREQHRDEVGCQEDIDACVRTFATLFPEGTVHAAPQNLGIAGNYHRLEQFCFGELEAEVAFILEDDYVLSPHYFAAMATVWRVVEDEPRIGMFSATGRREMLLDEQIAQRHRMVSMANHLAFAMRRDHWLRIRPITDAYFELALAEGDRRQRTGAIMDLFASWGTPCPGASHDYAVGAATYAVGATKMTTVPRMGRYIGEQGAHYTPKMFKEQGWAEAEMWPGPLPTPTCPTPADLDAILRSAHASFAARAGAR